MRSVRAPPEVPLAIEHGIPLDLVRRSLDASFCFGLAAVGPQAATGT